MRSVGVKEVQRMIGRLLDAVASGEEIIITRRGKPVAKLLKIKDEELHSRFPSRKVLRMKLPPSRKASVELVSEMRDGRG